LNLLRLNTVPPFDPRELGGMKELRQMSEKQLRKLGRIPVPLIRRKGGEELKPIGWEQALALIAERVQASDPRRLAFYVVSRGTANETYYVAQKTARFLGTNNIDNSARVCHASSTTGLQKSIGYAATTCSYRDVIGTDLLVFIGSDAANNQPVMMKYVHNAKKQGTKVAVINPFFEPGLDRYWVPSNVDSALFGTKICDHYYPIQVGGDIPFLNGVLKHLIDRDWIDHEFIRNHTSGWDDLVAELSSQSFDMLERRSGSTREQMFEFALTYASSRHAIFVWSMGVTQHRCGTDNVRAIVNLALARANVGREHTGLMPIRGHSGVQGGAEMACVPDKLPGGRPTNPDGAAELSRKWGFQVPDWKGLFAVDMIDAAARQELDILYSIGGNLAGILPDSRYVESALQKVPLRVHHDIVLNPQMFIDTEDTVVILPATTRYELEGGCTETTTERRVIYSPEIPGPRVPDARDEWKVLIEVARRVKPEQSDLIHFETTESIRNEIDEIIPLYRGIKDLHRKGDQFQWGGPLLGTDGKFDLPDQRALFASLRPPVEDLPRGKFHLVTRRGKQFNSMVLGNQDMLVGWNRNDVILSPEDLEKLAIKPGDRVTLSSAAGSFSGIVKEGNLQPGCIMVYWPEANVLIEHGTVDPECGIPAYRDALVEVERA
ncbi:MAG: FdhF/YdeP family oxidoreductase, partial [Acidobacteriota bacterium]